MSAGPIKNESSYLKSQVKLTPIYLVSIFIGILVLVASACSLLNPAKIYPTEALHQMFFANDVVNLVIGLPLLLGSLWLSWRGKLLGLLFWLGLSDIHGPGFSMRLHTNRSFHNY
jgi:hypothetical protein